MATACLALPVFAVHTEASPLFSAPFYSFDTGTNSNPVGIAIGDLNGDGIPDLAVAETALGNAGVLLGNGDGTFGPAAVYAAGDGATSVAIGDFNADGKPDLVVSCSYPNAVSILLGNGDGSFATGTLYGTGLSPNSVAVGDLNGDGRLDLVVACSGSNVVSVLLGNGNGTFGTKLDYATGASPWAVTIGDVNGDGKPDVVVANHGANTVSVLLGNGDGTLGAKSDYATGSGAYALALGDLDHDGALDIAVANYGSSSVSVLRGNGNGTFGAKVDYATDSGPRSVVIGDFDGDGRPDLVTANCNQTSTVSILLGAAGGGFAAHADYLAGDAPQAVAVGDLNGDGRLDLATANGGNFEYVVDVSSILGNGDGTFGAKTPHVSLHLPVAVAVGDMNGDGKADLVVPRGNNILSVALGHGDGTFGPSIDHVTGGLLYSVAIGDLNGDGKLDVVTSNAQDNTVSVFLGNGDGTLQAEIVQPVSAGATFVAIGDLNGDGKPDFAVVGGNSTVGILLGHGDGTFGAATEFGTGLQAETVAIGDLNGDGKPDLAVAHDYLSQHTVSVLLGNGDGSFRTKTEYNTGFYPFSVAIGDLDGDGKPDLVTCNRTSSLSVLLGNGDGSFRANTDYGVARNNDQNSVAIADLDGDGHLDIVSADPQANVISVWLGHGDGSFVRVSDFGTGAYPTSLALGDLNGDGRLDVAVACWSGEQVSVLLNASGRPGIVHQPVGQSVCSPRDLALSVQASGAGLSYRWRKNGADLADGASISGTTTPALLVRSVFPSDAGTYDVVISNTNGSATSTPATITVCEVPTFTTSPADIARVLGTSASFTITAGTSCTSPSLQWLKDGVPLVDDGRITGSATAQLSISSVQAADAGYYSVLATNGCGTQASAPAQLAVTACPGPPTIVQQPADVFVANGTPASFTVSATGCVPPTVQWLKQQVAIPGATSSTLSIPNVTDADAGFYQAVVTAGGVSTLSAVAVLNEPDPVFVTASHRYLTTNGCTTGLEVFWNLAAAASVRVDFEPTASSSFSGALTHSVLVDPATAGTVDITPSPWVPFVCYQLTATDAANRVTTTSRHMASLPSQSFSLTKIVPALVTYPFTFTLLSPGDAIGIGLQVTNGNCTALSSSVALDQAKLGSASPTTATGGNPLPSPVASGIAAGAIVRMPNDLRFLRSKVGGSAGSNVTFKGRITIATTPASTKSFSATVRLPQ